MDYDSCPIKVYVSLPATGLWLATCRLDALIAAQVQYRGTYEHVPTDAVLLHSYQLPMFNRLGIDVEQLYRHRLWQQMISNEPFKASRLLNIEQA